MNKNLTSGASITYGPDFPPASTAFDGSLFYKNAGSDLGLYLFSFVQDGSSAIGDQVSQGWNSITASGLYLAKTGDVMSGALSINTTSTSTTLGGDEGSLILNNTSTTAGVHSGGIRWAYGNSSLISAEIDTVIGSTNSSGALVFSTRGPTGALTERVRITESGIVTAGGVKYWNSANSGAGSGLDADLLDGQHGAFYQNAANITTGTLDPARLSFTPVQQGGGVGQGSNKIYLGFNSNLLQIQVDGSNFGSNWPVNVSGSAATANYANSAGAAPWNGITGKPTAVSAFTNDSGYAAQGVQNSFTSKNVNVGNNDSSGQIFQSSGTGAGASISFLRPNIYGLNVGLDSDNVFRIGGWSDGANSIRMSLDTAGTGTFRGNVTAYSDIRLKEKIKVIPNALEKVAQLRGVTFQRIDSGEKGTGVIAQEVREVLPEAVKTDGDGVLSVAYGNMVGLLIEAIKELKAEVSELRAKLNDN